MTTNSTIDKERLVSRWASLLCQAPELQLAAGALILRVPELELLAAHRGDNVRVLDGSWAELLSDLAAVGPCVATTRNAHAAIEQVGSYAGVTVDGDVARVHDDDFDLYLDLARIRAGLLVRDSQAGFSRGLHLFDAKGFAVHHVVPRAESQYSLLNELLERRAVGSEVARRDVPGTAPGTPRSDQKVDVAALRDLWATFQDEDALQRVLDGAGIKRHQALRLIGLKWAEPAVAKGSYLEVLRSSAASQLPIRISVRNAAASQGHVGSIQTAKRDEGYVRVVGRGLSLTIREEGVADSWIVRVPNGSSFATCLELYDRGQDGVVCLRDQGGSWVGAGQWRELLKQPSLAIPKVRTCPDQQGNN